GLPGDVRPDAEADQILSNKCSVVKAGSGKKAKVDRRMKEFEPLMGEWHSEGEVPMEPPMKLSAETKIERLGKFIVLSSVSQPAEMPDTSRSSAARPTASRSQCTTSTPEGSSGCS